MSEIDEKISTSGVIFGALIVQAGAKGDTGPQGEQGIQGIPGETGKDGKDYILTESDKQEIANNVKSSIQSTLDALSNKDASQDIEITDIKTKNNTQDARLDTLEADNTTNKENISNLQNDNTTNKINIKSLQDDNEVNKTDISNIKQEQTTQNTNIQELQIDNTSNKSKIEALEAKNTELDTNIQKNTESIAQLKEKDITQDSLIEQLQTKVVSLEAENTSLKNQIPSGEATGNPIHLTDSSDMECEIVVKGNAEQETGDVTDEEGNVIGAMPSPDYPSEIVTVGQNGSVEIVVNNGLETTDTNYQSYTKVLPIQKEFVKINGVEDTFIKQDGKWYEKHCSPNVIFDGKVNKFIVKSGTANNLFATNAFSGGKMSVPATNGNIIAHYNNYFKDEYSVNQLYGNGDYMGSAIRTSGDIAVGFGINSNITTVELANEWLQEKNTSGNPMKVYYPLKEPELIPCTAEQESILNSFYTYKNVTNVSMSGIGKIKIIYKQDQQTINKNYENRLAALEAAIIS